MAGIIIDGKGLADQIIYGLRTCHKDFPYMRLIIVTTGDNFAGEAYVRSKIKRAEEIGIDVHRMHYDFFNHDSVLDLVKTFEEYFAQDRIYPSFIIQLPMTGDISRYEIENIIKSNMSITSNQLNEIDVDGIISKDNILYTYAPNLVSPLDKDSCCLPCTPIGIVRLLDEYIGNLSGLTATILGRSQLVAKPLESFLIERNCTVTMCHTKTQKAVIKEYIRSSNIVISSMGNTSLLTKDFFNDIDVSDKILIDVGMNRNEHGKLRGDCDPEIAKQFKMYTPVPGGVGPMTVAMLMRNVVKHYQITE